MNSQHLYESSRENWSLDSKAKQAFTNVKKALTSTDVLIYFNASTSVTGTVDASMKGLGSAILQENEIVANAEQRYAQIEKELLGVVFGCELFHKLLYGKSDVTIDTDHKALSRIIREPIHQHQ